MKNLSSETKKLFWAAAVFLLAYLMPFENAVIERSIQEAFMLLSEYAREHVLFCLVPAFFIAGAITVFVNQQAVIAYLGPKAKKWVSYSVASISGMILAVCSCTILPLFKGIYQRGAGLGPAIAFLYSGPAVNVLAIILTARILGFEMGLARIIAVAFFSVAIGLLMHLFFKKEEQKRLEDKGMFKKSPADQNRTLGQNALYLFSMIGILVFINWAPSQGQMGWWDVIFNIKYWLTGFLGFILVFTLWKWFKQEELKNWVLASRDFGLQILPLLFAGVLISGFLLGRPGHEALIPSNWIASLVGDNGIIANVLASVFGTLMYFATLTEIPILQGLMGAGMAKGPALALLLSGPSLSLPSILVIRGELGWKKTLVYTTLVILFSACAGLIFGNLF